MKYIYRGYTIFEYLPDQKTVIEHTVPGTEETTAKVTVVSRGIPAFNYCKILPDDMHRLSVFFSTAYLHTKGIQVELKDTIVD